MLNIIKSIDKYIFHKYNFQYLNTLERELEQCDTFLDIGCGENTSISKLNTNFEFSLGIDVFTPSLEKAENKGIYDEYLELNITEIDQKFSRNSFDCVAAFDVIEHFTKEDGISLLKKMESIAKKKIIIFTPNGFLPQDESESNKHQKHLSGWEVDEMNKLGFKVYGINGWKLLRGYKAKIKWQPIWFWSRLSRLSQIFTLNKPKAASQILCIKELIK